MGKRIETLLILTAIAGVLIAGCGNTDENDESGSETAAAGTISKAKFLEEGNFICEVTVQNIAARIQPELEKQRRKGKGDRRELEVTLADTIVLEELFGQVGELEGLGLPPGDEAEVRRIFTSILNMIERERDKPRTLTGTRDAFAEPSKVAESYGLDNCPYG